MIEQYNGIIGITFINKKPVKYLLIKNKKTGDTTFPSGGRHIGELFSEDTLKREILEETGLTTSDYKIKKTSIVHEVTNNEKRTFRTGQVSRQQVYLVETRRTDLNPKDKDIQILGWFTAEEVMTKLTSSDSKDLFLKATKEI